MRIAFAALAAVALAACVETPAPVLPYSPPPPAPVVEYVNEQQILAPLPVRVRLPDHYGAEKVLVFYNMWGTDDWKTLDGPRDVLFDMPNAKFDGSSDDGGRPHSAQRAHRRILELPNGDLITIGTTSFRFEAIAD